MKILAAISQWFIPSVLIIILIAGHRRKVKIYEVFIQGAMDGIKTTLKLAPYLLAIFVAIGLFRNSGALNLLTYLLKPFLIMVKLDPELLALSILKPLSGSASLGTTAELLLKYGPDSVMGLTASLIQGSGETTFYVLSVYLGAVNVKDSRHLLLVGLASEFTACCLSLAIGRLLG